MVKDLWVLSVELSKLESTFSWVIFSTEKNKKNYKAVLFYPITFKSNSSN
jgi:hypothetical protein